MTNQNVRYFQKDGLDDDVLKEMLDENHYDAIIDFMLYTQTAMFEKRCKMLLEGTKHYIFLSTYRVYSSLELPIRESSPRLLDASCDKKFLQNEGNEYSLYKARQENVLRACGYDHWTIVRPAITFSKYRYQLVTLEAPELIVRALQKKPVILPEQAMDVQATMSWAGDVGKLFARLVLNQKTFGETYSICTSEHHTWREIAQYYKELIGLDYITVDTETYLNIMGWRPYSDYQLLYDRCLNRIMDNSKILDATGMKQSELTPIKEALAKELACLPAEYPWPHNQILDRMDAWLEKHR